MITFSVKPMTLKDHVLVQRVSNQDMAALIELIARRSDPTVSESVAGELTNSELAGVMERLAESITASSRIDSLMTDALKDLGA